MTYAELEAGLRALVKQVRDEAYTLRGQPETLFVREDMMRDAAVLEAAGDVVHEYLEEATNSHV